MNCDAAPLTDKQKDELIELRFQQLNEAGQRIKELEAKYNDLVKYGGELTKENARLKTKVENLEEENNRLSTLRSYRNDKKNVEVVDGVEFSMEQIGLVEIFKYNLSLQIKSLKQKLKELPSQIVNKLKEKSLLFYLNDTPELSGHYVNVQELDNLQNEYEEKIND